jgi:hypothetical protein
VTLRGLTILVGIFVVLLVAAAAWLVATAQVEDANVLLSLAVLAVGVVTLIAVVIRPARLFVERQNELGLEDLLFMDYDPPTEYLLQLHVAVANVGGRKAVLSGLFLDEFLAEDGSKAQPSEIPSPLAAQLFSQSTRYRIRSDGVSYREELTEMSHPPLVLEPDDVVTLRFRARRGIDWSARWTLEELKALADSLRRPIVRARVRAVYRSGRNVVVDRFEVGVRTVRHAEYVDDLRRVTADFTVRPVVAPHAITLE